MGSKKTVLIFADSNRRAVIAASRLLCKANVCIIYALHDDFPVKMITKLLKNYNTQEIVKYNYTNLQDRLLEIKKKFGVFHILPSGEKQIRFLLNERIFLEENAIEFCIKDLESFIRVSDKQSFTELCLEFKVKVPKTYPELPRRFEYNFVVKPKSFKDAKNVLKFPYLVDSKKAFEDLHELKLDVNEHFIQEYIYGPSIYYCAFYAEGEMLNSFTQINLLQQPNGKSVLKAAPFDITTDIKERVNLIFLKLKWTGPIMFEFKLCNQELYAIECNPRLWGPIQLCLDNGIDLISPCIGLDLPVEKPKRAYGYLWFNGIISGYIQKRITKQSFQTFAYPYTQKIRYKDIYFRKKTILYGIFELLLILNRLRQQLFKL